jgi:hypothetical protein
MYAMQRANGDWFAFDDQGGFRVPVFQSSRDAMQARTRNTGMLLFKPVALAERNIIDMAAGGDGGSIRFWLVDNPFIDVSRGHSIERAQLSRLAQDAAAQTRVGGKV